MFEKSNKIALLVFLLLVPLICGCISENDKPSGKINVVTTIAPLGDFVNAVGGDKVQVTVLVPPGAEPHTFEPTPTQMKEIAKADLYVMNGIGLEFWMDKVLEVNEKMVVIDSSEGATLLPENSGQMDPHIWLSLRKAAVQTSNICSGLVTVDPGNKDYYIKNRDIYLQKLKALDMKLDKMFSSKVKKIFIVDHPGWTYFAQDYGLSQVPLMENEKEPGPRHISDIIQLAKKNNITTIFVEPQYNPKSAEVIAREMGAKVEILDALAENYLENMLSVGQKIAKSLE